jgi:glutamate/tyrosine decarboxylase-like PLP-dependent enzyme
MFFCRHRESVAQAFRSEVTYLPCKTAAQIADASATFDPLTHSVQWSRRFIGLKLFMTLAERGETGLAGMLEHQTHMGKILREALETSGWRIVNSTPLPLVCFTRDDLVPTVFLAALRDRQIAWMSEGNLGGVPVIRACITSFRTTESDIEWVVKEMNGLASTLSLSKTA